MKARTSASVSSMSAASFGTLRTQLIGDLAPLLARGLGVVLNESGANEGGDHATALAAGMGEHVAA